MAVGKSVVLLLVACLASAHAAPLWGAVGHAVIASIAQGLIPSNVSTDCTVILQNQTMASVASWADNIKYQPGWEWSAPLHYINTPDWACNFDYARDCVNDVCVAGAILNYTKQLVTLTNATDLQYALQFVIHFVGDIHQPLHVGFTSDEGGNTLHGTFLGETVNLHEIWDTTMIVKHVREDFNDDSNQYVSYLLSQIASTWAIDAALWALCPGSTDLACPDPWANESVGLACTNAYVYPNGTHIANGFTLDETYYANNIPVIDMQLAKAGVRLAATLDKIFSLGARLPRL